MIANEKPRKTAIFISFMDNIGGAEIQALTLARGLDADIYTTNIVADKIEKMGFADVVPRIHSIGRVPPKAPYRHQLTVWRFRRLNLGKQYDFYFIMGDWSMAGAVHNHPNMWDICSPINELWHWRRFVRQEMVAAWKRPIFDVWVWFNQKLTLKYAKSVDVWVSIAENVRGRVKRYYGKDSTVIYPPTDVSAYTSRPSKDYWLSVNRLIHHKRVDIQVKAFSKMPDEKLIIVGSYEKKSKHFEEYKDYIEKISSPNIEIIHWADDKKLKELYSECKGFITTAKDEDFGMTPVEAMASGKPVVLPNEGGYRETVVDGTTGILMNDMDEKGDQAIIAAVKKISANLRANPDAYREACLARARDFDVSVFIEKMKKEMENYIKK